MRTPEIDLYTFIAFKNGVFNFFLEIQHLLFFTPMNAKTSVTKFYARVCFFLVNAVDIIVADHYIFRLLGSNHKHRSYGFDIRPKTSTTNGPRRSLSTSQVFSKRLRNHPRTISCSCIRHVCVICIAHYRLVIIIITVNIF